MEISNSLSVMSVDPPATATGSVIWLHGLGADGHDFSSIVPQLHLPPTVMLRFIFPHAPIRPVTMNGNLPMRAWFDIYSLANLAQQDKEGMLQSEYAINQLIMQEIAAGIPSQRIVLAGFSQGGTMALYTGLRCQQPLAGLIGLSTYLPLNEALRATLSTTNQHVPVLMAHGHFDSIVPLQLGQDSCQDLQRLNYGVEWHTYPMEHQVCADEITLITQWLLRVFAQ